MKTPEWSDDMMKSWADAQQQYWNAWGNLVQSSPNGEVPGAFDLNALNWAKMFDQWWSVSQPSVPLDMKDVVTRITDMGKMYMSMAEKAYQVSLQSQDMPKQNATELWMSMMESSFQDWGKQLSMGQNPAAGFGSTQANLEGWQKMLQSMGMNAMMPDMNPMMGSFSPSWLGAQPSMQDQWLKMLSMPGIGMTGDAQESAQKMSKQVMEYQESMRAYMEAFSQQGAETMQALRERVLEVGQGGEQINSLRSLFDMWVEVSESVYAKFAMSDQYQVVYADMVNSLMALKNSFNEQLAVMFESMNLVTQAMFNSSLKKQQALKRENRDLRKNLNELNQRVSALEIDDISVESVQNAPKPTAKASETVKPAAKKATVSTVTSKPASKPAPSAEPASKAPSIEPAKKAKVAVSEPATQSAKATTKSVKSAKQAPSTVTAKTKKVEEAPQSVVTDHEDDLTIIKGLGPKMSQKLKAEGIKNFVQLSSLALDGLAEMDKKLGAQGRLLRDDWVGQAKAFAEQAKKS